MGDQSSAGRSTIGSSGALRVGAHALGLDQPHIWAECSAEGFGTFLILIFGAGSVAQVVAGGSGLGDHNSIAWAWGFGVMLGVYVAGRISGAHLNPAVTVSLALFKGFPRRKIAPYVLAQTLGAFIAALIVRFDYSSVIAAVDPHHTLKTQIIFSTLPGNGTLPVGIWAAFADQILGTALLLFCIFAVTDLHNDGPPAGVTPIVVGLIVVVIGMAFGTDSGYAINPARDFGPRLASYLTGYAHAWKDQYGQYYFWVPIVGPLLGGPLGAGIYQLMIARHLAPADEQVAGLLPEEQDAS